MTNIENSHVCHGTRIVFLHGSIHTTVEALYQTLAHQLLFPDYFSYNLDSFDEIINDLDHLPEPEIDVVIYNCEQLGADNKEVTFEILDIMATSTTKKVTIFNVS